MSGKQLPLFLYCKYCRKRIQSGEEHLKTCLKFLGSFEEQFMGNEIVLDPTTDKSKTHIETVRKTLLDLEDNDDIGIFACGKVIAFFPTLFSKEDKDRVHSLMMKRLPYCTNFTIENRRLKSKLSAFSLVGQYNWQMQMWFLDNGGW